MFDQEDTGFINNKELRKTLSNLGDCMETSDIDVTIMVSDVDGDGAVLYDDVLKIIKENEAKFKT